MANEHLAAVAAESMANDTVIIEVVYQQQWIKFDIPVMQLKYLPIEEITRRYLVGAFAAVKAPTAEVGETHAPALSSSSQPNV
jgi:phosphoribosylaminoimidazole-succinocarboxamide synthase